MLDVFLTDTRQPQLSVDFKCAPGELLALVGPSGAGKSTVLRCIAGLHAASHGVIRSNHKDWFNSSNNVSLTPQQRRVGFVFQNYALFPHLTVAENIQLASPDKTDVMMADTLLSKVRLHGLGQRYPHQLSGGQQQRVALARALARSPEVLLLDEPFSAVDKVTRRKLYLELNSLRRELDMPIILVTHDLDEAAMLADTMVVIHHGHTLQQGTPDQILHQPNTANIAKLVDVRNLFQGNITHEDPVYRLQWHHFSLEIDQDNVARNKHNLDKQTVSWTISPTKVLLHQRLRPSRGEQENPIQCTIVEILTLRGITTVLMKVQDCDDLIIQMDLSEHVAIRNALVTGDTITVSLLASAIHLICN
ncbi:MAG: ABC transporter ATP-binding protein [Gammaproteobacteria bacterium]|nr:ABC transporter ATP-binding protein [Gammaproteobacteria bacterium]